MRNEAGRKLPLDSLRSSLNVGNESDDVEYLYANDVEGNRRWRNLISYLEYMQRENPEVLLIGEAPGYRGTSVSGVPFLSEDMIKQRQATGEKTPLDSYEQSANYDKTSGFEATSAIMWEVLDNASISKLPLLWAVFPNHPHVMGNALTNRKPTKKEIKLYADIVNQLIEMYDVKHIIAVGNVAYDTLSINTNFPVVKLRHPARGGAKIFKDGFNTVMENIYGIQQ